MKRTPVAKTIEIKQRGETGAFDLVIDGQPFLFALARQPLELEEIVPGSNPLYVLLLPLFAESVVGLEEFNAFILEEEDRNRVRSADIRDSEQEVD